MATLEEKIAEQQKVIRFLTSSYEKDTGRRLTLPTSLGQFLGDPSIMGQPETHEDEEEKKEGQRAKMPNFGGKTFMEAIEMLDLPKKEIGSSGGRGQG